MTYHVEYVKLKKNNNFYIEYDNKKIYLRKSKTIDQAKKEAFDILINIYKNTLFIIEEA